MDTATQTIGRGIIQISRSFTKELFPELLNIDDCTLQGELKSQGVFDKVHKRMLLPESYTIIGIFYGNIFSGYIGIYGRDLWLMIVESPEIPLDEAVMLPVLETVYTRHSDGSNSLVRIDISK